MSTIKELLITCGITEENLSVELKTLLDSKELWDRDLNSLVDCAERLAIATQLVKDLKANPEARIKKFLNSLHVACSSETSNSELKDELPQDENLLKLLQAASSIQEFIKLLTPAKKINGVELTKIIEKKFRRWGEFSDHLVETNNFTFIRNYLDVCRSLFKYSNPFDHVTTVDMVEALVEAGIQLNPRSEGTGDHSALIQMLKYAKTPPSLAIVNKLVEKGCNVNHRSNCGTALSWAKRRQGTPDWDTLIAHLEHLGGLTPEEIENPELVKFRKMLRRETKQDTQSQSSSSEPHKVLKLQQILSYYHVQIAELDSLMNGERSLVAIALPNHLSQSQSNILEFINKLHPALRRQLIFFAKDINSFRGDLINTAGLPPDYCLHFFSWDKTESLIEDNEFERERIIKDYPQFCRIMEYKMMHEFGLPDLYPTEVPIFHEETDLGVITKITDSYKKYIALDSFQRKTHPLPRAGEVYFHLAEALQEIVANSFTLNEKLELCKEAQLYLLKAQFNGHSSEMTSLLNKFFVSTSQSASEEIFRHHMKQVADMKGRGAERIAMEYRSAIRYLTNFEDYPKRFVLYNILGNSPCESIYKVTCSSTEFKSQLKVFEEKIKTLSQLPYKEKYDLANDLLKFGLNYEAEKCYRDLLEAKETGPELPDVIYRLGHLSTHPLEKNEFFTKALEIQKDISKKAEILFYQASCLQGDSFVKKLNECLSCNNEKTNTMALHALACHFYQANKLDDCQKMVERFFKEAKLTDKNQDQFFVMECMQAKTLDAYNNLLNKYDPSEQTRQQRAVLRFNVFKCTSNEDDRDYYYRYRNHLQLINLCGENGIGDLTRRVNHEDVVAELVEKHIAIGRLELEFKYLPDALYELNQAVKIAEKFKMTALYECYRLRAQVYKNLNLTSQYFSDLQLAIESAEKDARTNVLPSLYFDCARDHLESKEKDLNTANKNLAKLLNIPKVKKPENLVELFFRLRCLVLQSKAQNTYNANYLKLEQELVAIVSSDTESKSITSESFKKIFFLVAELNLSAEIMPTAAWLLKTFPQLPAADRGLVKFEMAKNCYETYQTLTNHPVMKTEPTTQQGIQGKTLIGNKAKELIATSFSLLTEAEKLGVDATSISIYRPMIVREISKYKQETTKELTIPIP